LDDAGVFARTVAANEIAAIHDLALFSGVELNDSDIDSILAMTTVGQSVTGVGLNNETWFYRDVLTAGTTGDTGGSVGGGDAFILLDGASGIGVSLEAIPEPATLSLVGLGAIGMIVRRRRS
jgi:NADPH-dependent 2,4-dienoyl-CoA reductase/sulfur reductase-like enzyme